MSAYERYRSAERAWRDTSPGTLSHKIATRRFATAIREWAPPTTRGLRGASDEQLVGEWVRDQAQRGAARRRCTAGRCRSKNHIHVHVPAHTRRRAS